MAGPLSLLKGAFTSLTEKAGAIAARTESGIMTAVSRGAFEARGIGGQGFFRGALGAGRAVTSGAFQTAGFGVREAGGFISGYGADLAGAVRGGFASKAFQRTFRPASSIGGALIKHAAPRFAAAGAIDAYMDTPSGQEMSGAGHTMLGLASFGLKFGAGRHLLRGAIGSGMAGAGRALGDPRMFRSAYQKKVAPTLGGFLTPGSLMGKVGNLAVHGAAEVGRLPVRMALGWPAAAFTGGKFLKTAVLGGSMTRAMSTMWPKSLGRTALQKVGVIGKEGLAPVQSGFFTIGMVSAGMYAAHKHNAQRHSGWAIGSTQKGINPDNYGGGISVRSRSSGARNYGPSLTLLLHNKHSRVMQ